MITLFTPLPAASIAVTFTNHAALAQVTTGFDGNTVYEIKLQNFPDLQTERRGVPTTIPQPARKDSVLTPDGSYLGSDPDSNVRLELRRDECIWVVNSAPIRITSLGVTHHSETVKRCPNRHVLRRYQSDGLVA